VDKVRYFTPLVYDFASEGDQEIQEESKMLISASVLGLVFEKINGFCDGSFFYMPGFIIMYMCRQIIWLAMLQKFKYDHGSSWLYSSES
jgi:adenine-specific DNA-methyltransferase